MIFRVWDALALIPDHRVASGSHLNTEQQSLIQELTNLQEHLEGELNRQMSQQHEQHLQREQQACHSSLYLCYLTLLVVRLVPRLH